MNSNQVITKTILLRAFKQNPYCLDYYKGCSKPKSNWVLVRNPNWNSDGWHLTHSGLTFGELSSKYCLRYAEGVYEAYQNSLSSKHFFGPLINFYVDSILLFSYNSFSLKVKSLYEKSKRYIGKLFRCKKL